MANESKLVLKKKIKMGIITQSFSSLLCSNIVQSIARVIIFVVMARFLRPEFFGIITTISVITGLFEIIAQIGMGAVIVHKQSLSNDTFSAIISFSILNSIVCFVIMLIFSNMIIEFFKIKVSAFEIFPLSFAIILNTYSYLAEAFLCKNFQFKRVAIIQAFSFIIGSGFIGIYLAVRFENLWSLVLAQFSTSLIMALCYYFYGKLKFKFSLSFNKLYEVLRYGADILGMQIANFIALQADNIIVGRMLGQEALGIYSRAYQMMAMPANAIGKAIDKVIFSTIAKMQADEKEINKIFFKSTFFLSSIVLPFSLLAHYFSPYFILLILGPKWSGVIEPFKYFVLGIFFRVAIKIGEGTLKAIGKTRPLLYFHFAYAIFVVAGSIVGAFHGIEGVAFSIFIVLVLLYFIMVCMIRRFTTIVFYDLMRAHFYGLIAFVIIFAIINVQL